MLVPLALLLPYAHAEEQEFDNSFIRGLSGPASSHTSNLGTLLKEHDMVPGTYSVSVYLDGGPFGQRELVFTQNKSGELTPCLTPELLEEMGIKLDALSSDDAASQSCIDLQVRLEGARVRFEGQKLVVHISVPQMAMSRDARGYVPSTNWDSGINAGFMNYQLSGSQSQNRQSHDGTYNLYLNGGLNLGDWRLRSSSSYSKHGKWEHATTYAQRDLPGTAGTLTLGESVTPGDTFQSIPFRGVQVATDVDMLPDSMQGYAPVIHGIAQTRAKVEVLQHGYSLYTTYVSPGPFEIRDLSAAMGSGDLEVIITEADGSVRRFTQPYATLGNLLRQGTWRYGVTLGEYNQNDTNIERPVFTQASLAYGLGGSYTLAGGGLFSDGYRAWQVGLGKDLGSLGAVSLDVTQSATQNIQGTLIGQSYGARYGKAFDSGTNIRFAGYRYSTEGYRDFSEAVELRRMRYDPQDAYRGYSRRNRLEASVSQNLDSLASVYLNLSQQDYWGLSSKERQVQFGVNTSVSRVNVGLYASKILSRNDHQGAQVGLTFSFPLGGQSASVSLNRNTDGSNDQRLGLSGMAGDYGDLNYSMDLARNERSANTGSASVGYRAPWAQVSAGGSSSSEYRSLNLGVSGSVLAHANGIQLGQRLGETMALLEVKGIPNVGVSNSPGQMTDSNGYSLIPYVRPYRRNRISLDTSQLDTDTDILTGVTSVVPRRGAVVVASFKAERSEKVLATFYLPDGNFVPFGSAIINNIGQRTNAVGQRGVVLLSVGEDTAFEVEWGPSVSQRCKVNVDMSAAREDSGFKVIDLQCFE